MLDMGFLDLSPVYFAKMYSLSKSIWILTHIYG